MYNYGILRTDDSDEARQHNEKLLGSNTLGIEVTRSDLAAQCGLGNIDSQHGQNPHSDSSAIRDSLTYALPPEGTTLVTIRPDADALGAMAVLTARQDGQQNLIRHELIEMIHLIDCLGVAEALRANPRLREYKLEKDVIQQIIRNSSSRWLNIKDRVFTIMQILTGIMSRHNIEEIALMRERVDYSAFAFVVIVPDKVMLITVKGQYGPARSCGQARFPVTIICDDEYVMPGVDGYTPHKRWCVAKQHDTNVIDMECLKKELNRAEAEARDLGVQELEREGLAWGGPENLVSSPYGKFSKLCDDEILFIIKQCVR